jgi:hypothetical protein
MKTAGLIALIGSHRFSRFRLARLGLALWMALLLNALPASAGSFKSALRDGVPDVYAVVLAEGVARKPHGPDKNLPAVAQVAQELGRAHGGQVEEVWEDALQGFVIRMPEARARKLAGDPRVLVVEQDFSFSPPFAAPVGDCFFGTPISNTRPLPSSTSSPQTLSCDDPDPQHDSSPTGPPLCVDNWGIDRIDQLSGRNNSYYFTNNGRNASTTVHIYVMDTGIRRTHREFQDASGASRVIGGADARAIPVDDSVTADTGDCYGHGTHVAGIIGGRTYGVAKNAILHPVRILGCPGPAFVTPIVRALNWISSHAQRPAVINWSGGNDPAVIGFSSVGAAVQGVLSQGIVLVQAAGNQSPDYDPVQPGLLRDACDLSFGEMYPGVIVAGGIDEYDGRWTRRPSLDADDARQCEPDCGSNAGSCVDIWAPASHVVSSNMSGDNLACRLSGTSMAAPHVTGVVALYLEDHPNATISEVEQALRSRGTWNVLETGAGDPNYIGPASDNVVLYSDTLSLGPDLPPDGTFTVTCPGRTCSFNATGSTDDFGITSFLWRYGDSFSDSGPIVQHVFPAFFSGRVTLTVTDGLNHADHFSKVVTVNDDAPPVASFTYSCTGRTCTFNASSSSDDRGIVSWTWSFGDGFSGSGQVVTHTYSGSGTSFPVELTVSDTVGQTAKKSRTVPVAVDNPPIPKFSFTCSFLSCSFNAGSSTDDFGITSYTWNFGDGGAATGVTTSHTYAATSPYTVMLTVTDTLGQQSSTSKKVSVTDEIPGAAEGFFTVPPCRVADTRTTTPLTTGVQRTFQVTGLCGIPASAKAVSFNATVVSPTGGGNLVFLPGNQTSGPFGHSAHNFDPANSPRANNGFVRLATNGAGSINVVPIVTGSPGQVHLILDVYGYFSEDATPAPGAQGPLGFQTLTPCRIADTRTGAPIAVNTTRNFTVQGICGVPAGAAAAPLNLSVISPTAGGFALLFQAGVPPGMPVMNFNAGVVLTNGARIRLAPTTPDVSVWYYSPVAGAQSTHALIDVFGYFKSDAPLKYRPITACRAVDTRFADQGGPVLASPDARNFQIRGNCGVPTSAKAVAVNITSVGSAGGGYLVAYPSGGTPPLASYLTFDPGQGALGNGGIVALSTQSNDLTVTTSTSTHVIIDVFGYFQ